MTSGRTYRDAMSVDEALAVLEGCAGGQFDPEIAQLLGRLVRQGGIRLPRSQPPAGAAA